MHFLYMILFYNNFVLFCIYNKKRRRRQYIVLYLFIKREFECSLRHCCLFYVCICLCMSRLDNITIR